MAPQIIGSVLRIPKKYVKEIDEALKKEDAERARLMQWTKSRDPIPGSADNEIVDQIAQRSKDRLDDIKATLTVFAVTETDRLMMTLKWKSQRKGIEQSLEESRQWIDQLYRMSTPQADHLLGQMARLRVTQDKVLDHVDQLRDETIARLRAHQKGVLNLVETINQGPNRESPSPIDHSSIISKTSSSRDMVGPKISLLFDQALKGILAIATLLGSDEIEKLHKRLQAWGTGLFEDDKLDTFLMGYRDMRNKSSSIPQSTTLYPIFIAIILNIEQILIVIESDNPEVINIQHGIADVLEAEALVGEVNYQMLLLNKLPASAPEDEVATCCKRIESQLDNLYVVLRAIDGCSKVYHMNGVKLRSLETDLANRTMESMPDTFSEGLRLLNLDLELTMMVVDSLKKQEKEDPAKNEKPLSKIFEAELEQLMEWRRNRLESITAPMVPILAKMQNSLLGVLDDKDGLLSNLKRPKNQSEASGDTGKRQVNEVLNEFMTSVSDLERLSRIEGKGKEKEVQRETGEGSGRPWLGMI
ncbi:hypothetical protein F4778DRAFT_268021 [Xylariomycetidae sp. FL2044]|nr:hypothetical protein F4778DRAFT_268021 [Xylariomycetidae sp. FL2044]